MKKIKQVAEAVYYKCLAVFFNFNNKFYNLRQGLRNLWSFRKVVWQYRGWDFDYSIDLLLEGLIQLRDAINKGPEVEVTRVKKVQALDELINLIKHKGEEERALAEKYLDNSYYDNLDKTTEKNSKEEEKHKKNVLKYISEVAKVRDKRHTRIMRIIKGQTNKEIKAGIEKLKEQHNITGELNNTEDYSLYSEVFDGTGYENWWC